MECMTSDYSDLIDIAKIHVEVFPDDLSSKCGIRYTRKMIEWYLNDSRAELFHLENSGKILGYCWGHSLQGSSVHGSATDILKHTGKELVISFICRPWLIWHPEVRSRLPFLLKWFKLKLRSQQLQNKAQAGSEAKEQIPSMMLVMIGIKPGCQGNGFGKILLHEFERRAKEKGFSRVHLNVQNDNEHAISAYKKNGWMAGAKSHSEMIMFKEV